MSAPPPTTVKALPLVPALPAGEGFPMSRADHGLGIPCGRTVMRTTFEAVLAPPLSVATAVRMYDPVPALFQLKRKGLVVAAPIQVEPAKKSTRATIPSLSVASTVSVTVAGEPYVVSSTGDVNATDGGALLVVAHV